MFTQKELSLLAEAMDFFVSNTDIALHPITDYEELANKVVSLQEADQDDDDEIGMDSTEAAYNGFSPLY